MVWDDDVELPIELEAALQAADAEFEHRNGSGGGSSGGGTEKATAAAQTQQPAASAAGQATAQQGALPPALEPAQAQVAAPPPRRRRQLPASLQGGPPPSGAGSRAAGHGDVGNAVARRAMGDENLPPAAFPGRLHYAFTAPEVDRLCQWVLESGIQAVGFDIEWWVTYQAGVTPRKVALIQLCYLPPPPRAAPAGQAPAPAWQHECLLLHIAHSGITPYLRRLLCSEAVLKVGVGTHGDALKVCRDFGFEMQGVLCLSEYANARLVCAPSAGAPPEGPASAKAAAAVSAAGVAAGASSSGGSLAPCPQLLPAPQKWSLAALVSHLMRLRLEKSQGLRCSNWEVRPPLSSEQMRYAATDAWASLRCHEILAKLPVLAPAPAPDSAAGPALGGAAQLAAAAAAAAAEGAVAADDWVPACAGLRHLQPAKLAVYQALQQQGLSVAQVAAQRRIQEDSVQGYMAEAICAGMGYSWARLGVPPAALQQMAGVCSELLGRQLSWRPALHRAQQQRQEQQEQAIGQQCPAVGSKRPPPCSPSSLAAAAAEQPGCSCTTAIKHGDGMASSPAAAAESGASLGGDDSSSAGNGLPQPGTSDGQPVDILELLLAAGHKLRELKEERFEEVSYGQLRLALAHLGRLNPGPWDS